MHKNFYILLFFIFIISSVVEAEIFKDSYTIESNDIQFTNNSDPVSWWQNDVIIARGYGKPPSNVSNSRQNKYLAKQAAIVDGYNKLAEAAGKVQITANSTIVNIEINAIIVGAKVISEEYDDAGNCTVTLQVPVYGVRNSFASAVLKPTNRENFPMPSENVATLGTYTGVVIDCGDLELNPVLTPSIQRVDNESIYSYNNLDSSKVIAKGMIGYKLKGELISSGNYLLLGAMSDGNSINRVGSNPLVIKAVGLNNDGSCPIISNDDANRILSENQVSHFLDDGSVIFMSNRILGMRM
ncbi:MAG: hypothetical protein IJ797_06595 [Selenomonadaceae bacterium]|nr:hypothetical protein [Selenomonadaceae bacterium]